MRRLFFAHVDGDVFLLEKLWLWASRFEVEEMYLLGNGIGEKSRGGEILWKIREMSIVYLRGEKEDQVLLASFFSSPWARRVKEQLKEEEIAFLEELPYCFFGASFAASHTSVVNPAAFPSFALWEHLAECFESLEVPILFSAKAGGVYFQSGGQIFSFRRCPKEISLCSQDKLIVSPGNFAKEKTFLLWDEKEGKIYRFSLLKELL